MILRAGLVVLRGRFGGGRSGGSQGPVRAAGLVVGPGAAGPPPTIEAGLGFGLGRDDLPIEAGTGSDEDLRTPRPKTSPPIRMGFTMGSNFVFFHRIV